MAIQDSAIEKLGPVIKARAVEFGGILAGMYAENKTARAAGSEYPHAMGALFIPARNAYRGAFDAEKLNGTQMVALARCYKGMTVEDKIRLRAVGAVSRGTKKQSTVDLDELLSSINEDTGPLARENKTKVGKVKKV
jgi:hypothetical protein